MALSMGRKRYKTESSSADQNEKLFYRHDITSADLLLVELGDFRLELAELLLRHDEFYERTVSNDFFREGREKKTQTRPPAALRHSFS